MHVLLCPELRHRSVKNWQLRFGNDDTAENHKSLSFLPALVAIDQIPHTPPHSHAWALVYQHLLMRQVYNHPKSNGRPASAKVAYVPRGCARTAPPVHIAARRDATVRGRRTRPLAGFASRRGAASEATTASLRMVPSPLTKRPFATGRRWMNNSMFHPRHRLKWPSRDTHFSMGRTCLL